MPTGTLRTLTLSIPVKIGMENFTNPPFKTHLENPLLKSLDGGGLQVQHHVHLRFLRAHVALHTATGNKNYLNFRRKYTIVALHTKAGNGNYDGAEF
jgi:hypothetical protein